MKILVVGGGGREHALVTKVAESKRVSKIFCAPGNAGIALLTNCVPIAADDVTSLLDFACKNKIDFTIVGPEMPLVMGITDSFKRSGLKIFGPSKEASLLEGSKVFAKDFCRRYGIPHARSESFSDADAAKEYLKRQDFPIVIKADGLAAGKGVVICHEITEAERVIDEMIVKRSFGGAGMMVVIEEFLEGEEASFIAICDGNHVLPLASSQDHKAAYDGDLGPNTGGMGAVSPAKVITEYLAYEIMEKVMLPTARGMVTEGMPFTGVLYAGLMIKNNEPKVLEFNVRFGDPETQAILVRLKTDIVDVIEAAVSGRLDKISLEWDRRAAACVVMASGGYPGEYKKGKTISGLDAVRSLDDVYVFHAGTKFQDGEFVTDGGRVLGVTALGENMRQAITNAYDAVKKISWEGAYHRNDIGHRALEGQC